MARAGLTAAKVTEAAAELADEAGPEGLTVSALARRLGVRDASIYSHVRNLRDLRVRVALLASAEMTDGIGAAVAGRAGKDALFAFADAYREYATGRPGRYAVTQGRFSPEEVAELEASGSEILRRNTELTRGMLRGYGLREPALTDAARLLRSTFHGYIHLERNEGFHRPRAVEESWRRSLEALHVLLENWPSHPDRSER